MKVLKGIGYWLLSLTWGCLFTIPGLLVLLFFVVFTRCKVHKNGYGFIIEVGGNWGGYSLGPVSLCGRYSQENGPCYDVGWYEYTRRHEFGHSLQNIMFGPFMLFLVEIPSIIRYHYYNYRINRNLPVKEYDSIWFEGTASAWGSNAVERVESV